MKLNELSKRIADHLAVEELEIKFDKIIDDSRLYPKKGFIVINEKYKANYIECAKSLAHEYRHVFQIYYANLMNDELAKIWRDELWTAKNSNNININNATEFTEYSLQMIEIDAEAFAIYYLRTFENINVSRKEEWFQKLIEVYIKKYQDRL